MGRVISDYEYGMSDRRGEYSPKLRHPATLGSVCSQWTDKHP